MATGFQVNRARSWPQGVLEEGKLEVVVLFTTARASQSALRSAAKLAEGLSAKIRLLVPITVPYLLPLNESLVRPRVLEHRMRNLAQQAEVSCAIDIRLCRDPWDAIEQGLSPRSLVVVGKRPAWWQRSERKLLDRLLLNGHQIAYAERRNSYA